MGIKTSVVSVAALAAAKTQNSVSDLRTEYRTAKTMTETSAKVNAAIKEQEKRDLRVLKCSKVVADLEVKLAEARADLIEAQNAADDVESLPV